MTQEDEIFRLQNELNQNPRSANFTLLADLYIKREMFDEALALVQNSLKFNPKSVSGLVLLGYLLRQKEKFAESVTPLTQATQLAPDNWKAWLELAQTQMQLKEAKKALAAFKKVLLFNPNQPLARRALAKLELVTADEYEEDVFQMQKIFDGKIKAANKQTNLHSEGSVNEDPALQRHLSYLDALILRQEVDKALELANQLAITHPNNSEIEHRRLKLSSFEKPMNIKPKSAAAEVSISKGQMVRKKQITALQMVLRRIQRKKSEFLST